VYLRPRYVDGKTWKLPYYSTNEGSSFIRFGYINISLAAGVDVFRTHPEGARVEEPAVPVQAAAARDMGSVGPRSREGCRRKG
jgi:hypothetical protein